MTPTVRRIVLAAIPLGLVVAFVTVPGLAEAGGPTLNAYKHLRCRERHSS